MMESNTQENFICPLCGGELLWMPVSKIFVCEHCRQSFSEGAQFYLRNEEMPREKSNGNMAAMHEALVKIEKMAHCDLCNVYPKYRDKFNDKIGGIEREARTALSSPPRNCDVGTADEQAQRYDKFCEGMDCVKCPVHALWHHYFEICKNRKVSCGLIWAQMPYEADAAFTKTGENVNSGSAIDMEVNKTKEGGAE